MKINFKILLVPGFLMAAFFLLIVFPRFAQASICAYNGSGGVTGATCAVTGGSGQICPNVGLNWYFQNVCISDATLQTNAQTCFNNRRQFDGVTGCNTTCRVAGEILCGSVCQTSASTAACDIASRNTNSCSGACTTCKNGFTDIGGICVASCDSQTELRTSTGCKALETVDTRVTTVDTDVTTLEGQVTRLLDGIYTFTGPLSIAGTAATGFTVSLTGCAPNQVYKWEGAAGRWVCADDIDTNTTYTAAAGGGLSLTGTAFSSALGTTIDSSEIVDKTIAAADFSSMSCANGQVLKFDTNAVGTADDAWECAAAGITSYTETDPKLLTICTAGQVLKWDTNGAGTADDAWECALDANTGSQWATSGSNISYSAGNVGIGTTTPVTLFDLVGSARIKGSTTSVLTGSIDPAASTTVTGVGTLFTTQLVPGDRITVTGETRTVTSIASNTSLTVDTAFSNNANDTAVDRLPAELSIQDSAGNVDFVVRDDGAIWGAGNSKSLRVDTGNGYIEVGPQNSNWAHIYTDRDKFAFNKSIFNYGGGYGTIDPTDISFITDRNASSTPDMTIKTDGKVGIGTSAPESPLEISSTTDNILRLRANEAGNPWNYIEFYNSSARQWWVGQDTDGDFNIMDSDASLGLTVENGGNVGIGTTNPEARLHIRRDETTPESNVKTNTAYSGLVLESDYTADNFMPGITWNTADNNNGKPKAGIWVKETGSGTHLNFGTSNSYATGITNNALIINPSGNVGIGTTTPTYLLDVNDSAKIRGDLEVENLTVDAGTGNVGDAEIMGTLTAYGDAVLPTGSIGPAEIASSAVNYSEIATDAVGFMELQSNSVNAAELNTYYGPIITTILDHTNNGSASYYNGDDAVSRCDDGDYVLNGECWAIEDNGGNTATYDVTIRGEYTTVATSTQGQGWVCLGRNGDSSEYKLLRSRALCINNYDSFMDKNNLNLYPGIILPSTTTITTPVQITLPSYEFTLPVDSGFR